MGYPIIDYSHLKSIIIREYPGRFTTGRPCDYSSYYIRKRFGLFIDNVYASPKNLLHRKAYRSVTPYGSVKETMFVSSDCKMPRDMLRRDYTIVHDKSKARYIVIPHLYKEIREYCHIAVKDTTDDTLYICTLARNYMRDSNYVYSEQEKLMLLSTIKSAIGAADDMLTFYHRDNFEQSNLFIVPDIPEYRDIFNDVSVIGRYVFDYKVQCTPSINISIETLDLWKRMSDYDALQKLIIQSDWHDYPVTVAYFIENEMQVLRSFGRDSVAMKSLLEGINFDMFHNHRYEGLSVTPKDFEMLTNWIMHHNLGLEDGKGYIDIEQYDRLPSDYQDLIRKRFVVAPIKLTGETPLESIIYTFSKG